MGPVTIQGKALPSLYSLEQFLRSIWFSRMHTEIMLLPAQKMAVNITRDAKVALQFPKYSTMQEY